MTIDEIYPTQEDNAYPGTNLVFYFGQESNEVALEKIIVQRTKDQWNCVHLVLTTDFAKHEKMEKTAFFDNRPENRLETVEGGFNPALKVHWEIALEPDWFHLLPTPDLDLKRYFQNLSKESPLLNEKLWKAISVWTEIPLGASIGGGSIKVGYQTIFSKPTDHIEALKRQGIVSKAIVTALLESNLPVYFDDESHSFRLQIRTGDRAYKINIKPDNKNLGLEITVTHMESVPKHRHSEAIALTVRLNKEVDIGEFFITKGDFSYSHHIMVSEELISFHMVSESLLAAVSLMRYYSPQYELLLTNNP